MAQQVVRQMGVMFGGGSTKTQGGADEQGNDEERRVMDIRRH